MPCQRKRHFVNYDDILSLDPMPEIVTCSFLGRVSWYSLAFSTSYVKDKTGMGLDTVHELDP